MGGMKRPSSMKYNRGRWMLERERCRLDHWHPPPPDHPATGVEQIVDHIMKSLGLEAQHRLDRLLENWPELAGAAVARHTRPARIDERGTLLVFVDSSPWLAELSRMGKRHLLQNIRKSGILPNLRDLRLQLDPEGSHASRSAQP